MKYVYFIGVDVSKNTLDLALRKGKELISHEKIGNDLASIKKYLKCLKAQLGLTLDNTLFCMEHTGIYNNPLLYHLHRVGGNVWLESAIHIKYSLGNIRGKNDKLDAIRISEFAFRNRDDVKLWQPKREVVKRLQHLTTLRGRMIGARKMLKTPLIEQDGYVDKQLTNLEKKLSLRAFNSIDATIEKIEKEIQVIIKSDNELSYLFKIVTSVQGIGKETAVNVIITTNEFKDITDPKKYACYGGVVPFSRESGLFKGKAKVSHMANKKIKTLLHMAALVAIVHNKDLKQYYDRKVAEGKNKMVIINAVRNKLVHRIFACVRNNREYENNYMTTLA